MKGCGKQLKSPQRRPLTANRTDSNVPEKLKICSAQVVRLDVAEPQVDVNGVPRGDGHWIVDTASLNVVDEYLVKRLPLRDFFRALASIAREYGYGFGLAVGR